MPRPLTKQQLISESQKEYQDLEKFFTALTPEAMIQPGVLGKWSVKDVLAHLTEWQQMFFGWYEAGLKGEKPAVPAEGYKWSQLPALNQKIYETYCSQPLPDVLAGFRAAHAKTMALVESLSEDELTTPDRYPWMNKNTLIAYLAANTSSHYHWARTELRKGLKKL